MNKVISFIFFYLALFIPLEAQISFGSVEVNNLYNLLDTNIKNEIDYLVSNSKNKRIYSKIQFNNTKLEVRVWNNQLEDLGLQLKGLPITTVHDTILKAFLERFMLKLSFEKNITDMIRLAQSMQINIYYQGIELLYSSLSGFDDFYNFINNSENFKITKNDYLFVTKWVNKDLNMTITFPNNYQLLVGKNRKELDFNLCNSLSSIVKNENTEIVENETYSTFNSSSLSVLQGSKFMNLLSSDTYYQKSLIDSSLIFDKSNIDYSVSNLLLSDKLSGNRKVSLTYNFYGSKSFNFSLNLYDLIQYFKKNYNSFIGIEYCSSDRVEGTLVYSDKYFNFIHLLHFKTNSTEIFNHSGVISANFYGNIPMHNVSDLFKESSFTKVNSRIDVQIK